MGARGDLGHHTAIGGMLGDLRQHDIGEDLPLAVLVAQHDGGGRFIAGGFDAENKHGEGGTVGKGLVSYSTIWGGG
ncbi:hypothetical protein GCM10007874_40570 [Labrys miyagiensis]|uniref:Uncharacterized protein n=1 Tax=Labrys miyagiensis TaxID=346912 RepID=A0ABQ6CQ60_9HYPH|nr:hypothetical protein GCM10007874_40570 [Labrys miyagiensis]